MATAPRCNKARSMPLAGGNALTAAFSTLPMGMPAAHTQTCPQSHQKPLTSVCSLWCFWALCSPPHRSPLLSFCRRGRTRTLLMKPSGIWMKMVIPKWTSKNLSSLWQLWLAAVINILSRKQPNSCRNAHKTLSLPVLHMLMLWILSSLPCTALQFTSMLGCKNKSSCAYIPVLNAKIYSFVEEPGLNGSH